MRWIDIVFITVITILVIAVAYLYTGNQNFIKKQIQEGYWVPKKDKTVSVGLSNAP